MSLGVNKSVRFIGPLTDADINTRTIKSPGKYGQCKVYGRIKVAIDGHAIFVARLPGVFQLVRWHLKAFQCGIRRGARVKFFATGHDGKHLTIYRDWDVNPPILGPFMAMSVQTTLVHDCDTVACDVVLTPQSFFEACDRDR